MFSIDIINESNPHRAARIFQMVDMQASRSWICVRDIKGLVEMGKAGHYPLFLREWMSDFIRYRKERREILSKKEGRKINQIILELRRACDLDEKQEFLYTLSKQDRNLFIHAFLTIVEGQILDGGPELQ